jgi:polyphosphate kinase
MAESFARLIRREAEHARAARPARIIAKMNSLLDKSVIQELYSASQAGVEIDLIVRGMCALRPGIANVSDKIRVRSIVGRFLEHSRAFYFLNGGQEEAYISSADWMGRNLYERAEVLCPIKNPRLLERVRDEILSSYLADNSKARLLTRSGKYIRARAAKRKDGEFSAQEYLMSLAEGQRQSKEVLPEIAANRRRARRVEPKTVAHEVGK